MATHRIAVIRGDGIGKEVVGEGLKVLESVSTITGVDCVFTEFPWGSDYYLDNGEMLPENGIEILSGFDAIFLGDIGQPENKDHITHNGQLLPIRRIFDQFVCPRPSVLYPGVQSPLEGVHPYDIDLVVVRENTEGEYADVGGFQYLNTPEEVAVQTAVFTRRGCERVIEYAFELARRRNKRKQVTSITKSNAMGYSMTLWDRTFALVAERNSDIETNSLLIDAACMDFIRRPESFDVVVASNLYGDILTDIGAIITGSMGLAASANINPDRSIPSMFEPVHGSAPDISGQGIANPMAQIMTAAMMLEHLGEHAASQAVQEATLNVLASGAALTPDLGGSSSTEEVGNAIVAALAER